MPASILKALNNKVRTDIILTDASLLFQTENTQIQDASLTPNNAIIETVLNLGAKLDAEKGEKGSGALVRRLGIFHVKVRVLTNTGASKAYTLCNSIESSLDLAVVPYAGYGDIHCENAYTMPGKLTIGNEACYKVVVPFWVWVAV